MLKLAVLLKELWPSIFKLAEITCPSIEVTGYSFQFKTDILT
jgi:hypothetical protein